MKFLLSTFALLCLTGVCQAAVVCIDNVDPQAGTYSNFISTANSTNSFTLTRTFDFDGQGTADTLTFDLIRTTYAQGTISSTGDVTVGAVNNGGNTNNWYSNFGDGESIQFEVQNITYTSGEMNGNTAFFDGFPSISRINIGSTGSTGASIDYLVHTGPVGSTTTTNAGGVIDLTSGGSSSSLFLTAEAGAAGIRLRDLDLKFSIVPEPSRAVLLLVGLMGIMLRRQR